MQRNTYFDEADLVKFADAQFAYCDGERLQWLAEACSAASLSA